MVGASETQTDAYADQRYISIHVCFDNLKKKFDVMYDGFRMSSTLKSSTSMFHFSKTLDRLQKRFGVLEFDLAWHGKFDLPILCVFIWNLIFFSFRYTWHLNWGSLHYQDQSACITSGICGISDTSGEQQTLGLLDDQLWPVHFEHQVFTTVCVRCCGSPFFIERFSFHHHYLLVCMYFICLSVWSEYIILSRVRAFSVSNIFLPLFP